MSTFVLDTQAILWFLTNDVRLTRKAYNLIQGSENRKLVSIASLWEIAIKQSIGKLPLYAPFASIFPRQLDSNGIEILAITVAHIERVSHLPFHHKDPFDRIIAAQCLTEELPLLSADPLFDSYGVERRW